VRVGVGELVLSRVRPAVFLGIGVEGSRGCLRAAVETAGVVVVGHVLTVLVELWRYEGEAERVDGRAVVSVPLAWLRQKERRR